MSPRTRGNLTTTAFEQLATATKDLVARVQPCLPILLLTPAIARADVQGVSADPVMASVETTEIEVYAVQTVIGGEYASLAATISDDLEVSGTLELLLWDASYEDAEWLCIPPLWVRPETGDVGLAEFLASILDDNTITVQLTFEDGSTTTVDISDISNNPSGVLPSLGVTLSPATVDIIVDQLQQSELGNSDHNALDELYDVLWTAQQ